MFRLKYDLLHRGGAILDNLWYPTYTKEYKKVMGDLSSELLETPQGQSVDFTRH